MSLTQWSGVLLQKLVVPQIVKKFSHLMEEESSLSYLQKLDIGPYIKPD
jgi:hypothetical protein